MTLKRLTARTRVANIYAAVRRSRASSTLARDMDDKSAVVVPFILERMKQHRESSDRPFFVGINGVQGVGKTTLVTTLRNTLSSPPYSLQTLALSIDDLYLARKDQESLSSNNPTNPLVRTRGQPGTHDLELGKSVFDQLRRRHKDIAIPSYDKSAFAGKGDRRPAEEWEVVNKSTDAQTADVVVFEGWCVGFRHLEDKELQDRWEAAKIQKDKGDYNGVLANVELEHAAFVNQKLKSYDALTDQLDAFVHIDTADTQNVYKWRLEQEADLRDQKGESNCMTDGEVVAFVDGYYPSYELFLDKLRQGVVVHAADIGSEDRKHSSAEGKQLRIVVDENRKVLTSEVF